MTARCSGISRLGETPAADLRRLHVWSGVIGGELAPIAAAVRLPEVAAEQRLAAPCLVAHQARAIRCCLLGTAAAAPGKAAG